MRAVRAGWNWFANRWAHGSMLTRVLLVLLAPFAAVALLGIAIPYEVISGLDRSGRLPEAVRWIAAVVIFLVVAGVAGAVSNDRSGVGRSESSPAPSGIWANPPPSEGNRTPVATPPVSLRTVDIVDSDGDLTDRDDDLARGPSYMDIVGGSIDVADGVLTARVELLGTPPIEDPVSTEISYGLWVDTTGDDEPEYQALISNIPEGGEFSGSLSRLIDGNVREGGDFPGEVSVGDTFAAVEVQLEAIEATGELRMAAFSEWTYYPDPNEATKFDMVTDAAPNTQHPADGPDWIILP